MASRSVSDFVCFGGPPLLESCEKASASSSASLRCCSAVRYLPSHLAFVRASDFKTAKKVGDGSYEDYCFTNNGAHDPGLAFHVKAGAKIHAVIDNWWPEDVENDGNGVFMSYVVGAPNSNSKLP